MRRNMIMLVVGTVVGLLIARAPAAVQSATSLPAVSRAIDNSLTLRPGETGSLYLVRGQNYGAVGEFFVSCTRSGFARTFYAWKVVGPPTLAVEGRGVSRGARPTASTFPGGVKPSGIEHWLMSTSGKPEGIKLDASLLVISAKPNLGYCLFSLRGMIVIVRH